MAARRNSKSTAMKKWDEELAKQAEIAAGLEEGSAGGQFFRTQGGTLTWDDAPMPNNEMGVIVLDGIKENAFYTVAYDPDNPSSPDCFAFGYDENKMQPHEKAVDPQADFCADCPHNQFGSAETGRGKACRNNRRLALIPAGEFDRDGDFTLYEDPDHYKRASIGFLKVPPTSVKGYAGFVRQVAGTLKRPAWAIATHVRIVPDPKSQFKIVFEPLQELPNDLLDVVHERVEEAVSTIDFPYLPMEEDETPKPAARGRSRKAAQPRTKSRTTRGKAGGRSKKY